MIDWAVVQNCVFYVVGLWAAVKFMGLLFIDPPDGESPFKSWLQYGAARAEREQRFELERFSIERGGIHRHAYVPVPSSTAIEVRE